MSDPKVWFITGSSAGLGRSMAETVLANGGIAVATLRKPEALKDLTTKYSKDKLLVLKLDVTKPQEIKEAFKAAIDTYGRIDVVYNNAGYGILGEVEGTPEEQAKAMFETNFWGASNVVKEAVRVFRDVNITPGGRLLNVASVTAVQSTPALAFYSSTKAALLNLADGLSKEIDPKWNIKITTLNFGGFKTRGTTTESLVVVPVHPAYTDPSLITQVIRGHILGSDSTGDTDKASALIFHKLVNDPNPPLHLTLGQDAVSASKEKLAGLLAEVEKYEEWSNDLALSE